MFDQIDSFFLWGEKVPNNCERIRGRRNVLSIPLEGYPIFPSSEWTSTELGKEPMVCSSATPGKVGHLLFQVKICASGPDSILSTLRKMPIKKRECLKCTAWHRNINLQSLYTCSIHSLISHTENMHVEEGKQKMIKATVIRLEIFSQWFVFFLKVAERAEDKRRLEWASTNS